jgi:hypothetical protein
MHEKFIDFRLDFCFVGRFLFIAGGKNLLPNDLSPIFPPVLWRIHNFIYGLMRPVFAMPFSWRIRWA